MTYDLFDLNLRVQRKQKSFLIRAFVLMLFSLLCVLLIIFLSIGEIIVISGVALFVTFLLCIKLFEKFNPKVLFSKGIKGENLKEGEYEIMKRGSYTGNGMRHKQVGSHGAMPYAPNTRANRKAFHKNMHFSGEVYLKTDDGNIVLISGLYGSHLEIYEEGDILLKPAGAKFPIVVSRDAERQPCPLCGEINGGERKACANCGLKILDRGDENEHKI